jgi:hypothetical protein
MAGVWAKQHESARGCSVVDQVRGLAFREVVHHEPAEATAERERSPQDRTFAELLIDCEEDRTLRAVLVGMLREASR